MDNYDLIVDSRSEEDSRVINLQNELQQKDKEAVLAASN